LGGFASPATLPPGTQLPLNAAAELPATVSVGVIQDITDDFRVMGEFQWQDWSVFDRLDLTVNGALTADPQNYRDAFFVAAGVEYDVMSELTLRAGAAWDQTPTQDSNFLTGGTLAARTPRVPDETRLWLSVGATYRLNDHMWLDAGYSYLRALDNSVVDLRANPGARVVYEGGAHIFSVGANARF
jgi:long-chain fatty acid transport protein